MLGIEAEEAHHLLNHLDWPGAVEDIRGAVAYLKHTEHASKVGVTGFCMGGALALAGGVLVDEVDAVIPFYGIPETGLADIAKIRKPVQAHFGNKDAMKGFSDPSVGRTPPGLTPASSCCSVCYLMHCRLWMGWRLR